MSEVTMPRLSDTMEEGTIARWLKHAGDEVKKGDILAEIETDKATMELEAYNAGVLEQILVQEGETVPIGQAIAVIRTGANAQKQEQPTPAPAVVKTDAASTPSAPAPTESSRQESTSVPKKSSDTVESSDGTLIKASPL